MVFEADFTWIVIDADVPPGVELDAFRREVGEPLLAADLS
jgi:hypothetical protein